MNEESSIQMDRKRKKQVGSQLLSLFWALAVFSLRKKGLSKGLAAASFFAYEDNRIMALRVLHLGAFIGVVAIPQFTLVLAV